MSAKVSVSSDKDLKAASAGRNLASCDPVRCEYALHCPSSPASVSTSSKKRLVQMTAVLSEEGELTVGDDDGFIDT